MGSETSTVTVGLYEAKNLEPPVKQLDAPLRVEATPAEAAVAVDGTVVAHGRWEGRLPLGTHTVTVSADGFLPQKSEILLERRKQPELHVTLARPPWRPKLSAGAGVAYGVGAVGLGVFAVSGGLALAKSHDVTSVCYPTCPLTWQPTANNAKTLGNVATAGLAVGIAGVAAGTLVLVFYRPKDRPAVTTGGGPWSVGAGPGRLVLEGRF
jgi:hypothetical protein